MWAPIVVAALSTQTGADLNAQLLASLTNIVTVAVSDRPGVDVLSAADVERVVAFEAEKQAMGCDEAESCLAEVAGAMGARWIVFGDVGRVGSRYLISLSLFDSEAGSARGRKIGRADDVDALVDVAQRTASELVADLPAAEKTRVVVLKLRAAGGVASGLAEPEEPEEPAEAGSAMPWIGATVLGGGALLVAGGVGAWALASGAHQRAESAEFQDDAVKLYDERDGWSVGAGALFVAGGLVAAGGVVVAAMGFLE